MEKLLATANIGHDEWLQARKTGIGGSDAGAICGLNPFRSPMDVYLDKVTMDIEENDNETMRQGRDLEEYVAQRFSEATGKKVRRCNFILAHSDYPFLHANIDRMVIGEKAGLECKTASAFMADDWEKEKVPESYLIQCLHYMAVTGADKWFLAVVVLGRSFRYFEIKRDEETIQNLIKIEKDFWENHVMKHIPPEPDGSAASEEYFKKNFLDCNIGKSVELPKAFQEKFRRYEELNVLIDKLEKEQNQISEMCKLEMGDAETAYTDGFSVSWKPVVTNRLDSKKLKSEEPAIYSRYVKPSSSRRFVIRAEKNNAFTV